jgi:methylmalonyl-CoA/ethylmalonyl-CoA epimerase
MSKVLFDHIAVAVPRLADAPAVLVGALGGVPDFGMPTAPYTFYQWRFAGGGRLEVLEPAGPPHAFLHRFLAQRGPGVHHVTFTVPSLAEACERARAHGHEVVGLDRSDPEWQEAFLHPRGAMGIVVQIVEVSGHSVAPPFPPPSGPSAPPPPVTLLGLRLSARSAERARAQWGAVLGGEAATTRAGGLVFRWPGSPMRIAVSLDPDAPEGPVAIEYASERTVALSPGPDPVLGVTFVRREEDLLGE